MTRFNDTISIPSYETTGDGHAHIGRLMAAALGTILLIGALAVTAIALAPQAAAPATTVQLDRIVDGWALAAEKPERYVVDGWALAAERPEQVVVDGWALAADGN
ncbi:MAG TPA: hypothetical protein VI277_06270 [Candidatus Limnocylindria bacterium]